jgi:hypothetical protein
VLKPNCAAQRCTVALVATENQQKNAECKKATKHMTCITLKSFLPVKLPLG